MLIGVAKFGMIGSSFVEGLLDERADREDIDVRVVASGSKMDEESCLSAIESVISMDPSLIVAVCPNASAEGPTAARNRMSEAGIPSILISDSPGIEIKDEVSNQGIGYVFVKSDPLIGARREFLDPVEMADFNSNLLKVLSSTGVMRKLQKEVDSTINSIKSGGEDLPRTILGPWNSTKGEFENPYARAKAMAALQIAEDVASVTYEACFIEDKKEKYIFMASSAHEMMRSAAKLSDEAREIEKSNDAVKRTPHSKEGNLLHKTKLLEKLQEL